MKVDISKVVLGFSGLSGSVFAGVESKPGVWRHKVDVTQSFINSIIQKYSGYTEVISAGDKQWEITVKQIK